MKKDIQNRQDIEQLVDQFYKRLLVDDLIGFFFTEIIALNVEEHLPVICDFWENILFGKSNYKGNPMLKHIALNSKSPLTSAHFERWLSIWELTITENYQGTKAKEAIERAKQIGGLMQFKIKQNHF